jgi:hypothetical protein
LEKYRSQEVVWNKLEKGPLRDYETGFCSPLALTVLEKKIFKDFPKVFHFLFGKYSEFLNLTNKSFKRTPRGTFLQKNQLP